MTSHQASKFSFLFYLRVQEAKFGINNHSMIYWQTSDDTAGFVWVRTYLSVVSPVKCHALVPEVFEEGGQDLILDVLGFHTISGTALLYHLVNTHFFVSNLFTLCCMLVCAPLPQWIRLAL